MALEPESVVSSLIDGDEAGPANAIRYAAVATPQSYGGPQAGASQGAASPSSAPPQSYGDPSFGGNYGIAPPRPYGNSGPTHPGMVAGMPQQGGPSPAMMGIMGQAPAAGQVRPAAER